ncbi:MAG: hypothetical protein JSS77_13085 [Acidobacteria bacterium]|nr:hypothetical protein [Acidobacteriota bacterium]
MATIKTYRAWLELEIGLDAHSIPLPWKERKKLFEGRIETCLFALEEAAPGIREKLEVHPERPFAFTGDLSADDIRAIWNLPELRLLSDQSASNQPVPDASGRLPFAVDVLWHTQAEDSPVVEVERVTVIVRATGEEEARRIAVTECSTMPRHFMGCDYRIHRRWWSAERASINTIFDEERMRHGAAIVVDQFSQPKLKKQPTWRPDESVDRVAYGSPKQRPKTWKWMLP